MLMHHNAMIHFILRGKYKLNVNKTIAECFLCFKDIEKVPQNSKKPSKLFNLNLIPKPKQNQEDSNVVRILSRRSDLGDKQAMQFVEQIKSSETSFGRKSIKVLELQGTQKLLQRIKDKK